MVRSVLGKGGHIPVYRESARAGDAYRDAIAAIQRGEIVAFYPEATYTADPDGWPMKAKNGVGRIALVTGAPVIPVANWGTQHVLPPGAGCPRLFPRRRVAIVAGPARRPLAWEGGPRTRTALDGVTAAIMTEVTRLVGEIRGETPPAEPFDPAAARRPKARPRPAGDSSQDAPAELTGTVRPAARRSSRRGVGQRTDVAQPSFSNAWITRAEMSTWPRCTPWRAQVGSAWCRLCHDSPKDRTASGQTLREWSRAANGASPIMWQIELIDHVTWCSSATRTRPGPEERGERAPPRPGQQAAEQGGHQQRGHRQQDERAGSRA